jgi:hypothetical protein
MKEQQDVLMGRLADIRVRNGVVMTLQFVPHVK